MQQSGDQGSCYTGDHQENNRHNDKHTFVSGNKQRSFVYDLETLATFTWVNLTEPVKNISDFTSKKEIRTHGLLKENKACF